MSRSNDGESDGQQPPPANEVKAQQAPVHRRVLSQVTAIPVKDTVYIVSIIITAVIVFYSTVGGLGRRISDLEARNQSRGLIEEYLDEAILHKQVNSLRLLEDEVKHLGEAVKKRKGRPKFAYFKAPAASGRPAPSGVNPNQEYLKDSGDLPAGFGAIMLSSILHQDQHFRAIANEDLVSRIYEVYMSVTRYDEAIIATHMPPLSDPRSLPRILPGTTKQRAEGFADIALAETSRLDGLLRGLPEMLRNTRQNIAAKLAEAHATGGNPRTGGESR